LITLADIRSMRKGRGGRLQVRRRRGPQRSTVVLVAFLLLGLAIIAYPTFSDWWNSYHQTRAIASYVQAVEEVSQEEKDAMIAEAVAYNERLVDKPDRYRMTEAEEKEYRSILDPTGSGVMGYIQVSSIGVNLPVYHGVDESVLQVAIGHIEGTSLPVGGPTTHAAVSGHRGLPSAKLFTDLDKLVEGDTFTVTILDRTCTYEVDQIRIVDPTDMSDLNLQQGADYVTLVTCTPYGINTHRLLVRGHRIDNIAGRVVIPAEALQIPNYIAVPAVAIPMLFAYLVGSLIYYRFFGGTPDREKVMAALEDMRVQAYDASEEDTNHE
jgi:sortase A